MTSPSSSPQVPHDCVMSRCDDGHSSGLPEECYTHHVQPGSTPSLPRSLTPPLLLVHDSPSHVLEIPQLLEADENLTYNYLSSHPHVDSLKNDHLIYSSSELLLGSSCPIGESHPLVPPGENIVYPPHLPTSNFDGGTLNSHTYSIPDPSLEHDPQLLYLSRMAERQCTHSHPAHPQINPASAVPNRSMDLERLPMGSGTSESPAWLDVEAAAPSEPSWGFHPRLPSSAVFYSVDPSPHHNIHTHESPAGSARHDDPIMQPFADWRSAPDMSTIAYPPSTTPFDTTAPYHAPLASSQGHEDSAPRRIMPLPRLLLPNSASGAIDGASTSPSPSTGTSTSCSHSSLSPDPASSQCSPASSQVAYRRVATRQTRIASAARRKRPGSFQCKVPDCKSTFTARHNLNSKP
ncbi:hypothetical protein HGRIS_004432 [Hohenbuehelia grisea]|uniref:C2H2-type domain-containing protein n=1 Tax=Hohenbuehelia grisea TaxID=104357 RepID=A0ABR3JCH9_9AGAR